MSDTDDAGLLRQVRDAEAALDERPAPRVRQAVLRAAAHAARPDLSPRSTPAVPPARAARIREGWGWPPRSWGWSIPAAASVLVGAIAVGVVSEMQRSAVPGVAASATATEKEASAPEAAAPPLPVAAPSASGAATRSAGTARPAIPSLAPAAESSNAPPAPSAAQAALSKALPQARIRQERSQPYAALPEAAQSPAEDSAMQQDTRSAPAARTAKQVQSPAPAMASTLTEPRTPQQWIDRIVAMRRAGRQDEADRELALLRKRYPEFLVPAAALRPPG